MVGNALLGLLEEFSDLYSVYKDIILSFVEKFKNHEVTWLLQKT